MRQIHAFMIAGTNSGCGKTTVSIGIMASLRNKGFRVQAFKVGPDFIDPGHHKRITNRPSHNLDGWMMTREFNKEIFYRYASNVDIAIVEGVMGLYDGFSGNSEAGSSAQIAKWLGLPVILVIDASSLARSVAAICLGYKLFDTNVNIVGFILNKVASPYHAQIIKEAMKNKGLNIIGILFRKNELKIPSRHLGLITADDLQNPTDMNKLACWIDKGVNISYLLKMTRYDFRCFKSKNKSYIYHMNHPTDKVRIGIAIDKAFCFYYEENIRLLKDAGAEIIPFSPLKDKRLPYSLDGLIFGGGYPELNCSKLTANNQLMEDIKSFSKNGGPIYAECGGFMYLMDSLIDMNKQYYKMVGIFPFKCQMHNRLKALGYREIITEKDSVLGPAGTKIRGHEFHYSDIINYKNCETIYNVIDRYGNILKKEGYIKDNVIGSYIHLHFGSNPNVATYFVDYCKKYRLKKELK